MRLRLLPVLIVAAGVAFAGKVGGLWQGFGAVAQAQTAAPAEPPGAAARDRRAPPKPNQQAAAVEPAPGGRQGQTPAGSGAPDASRPGALGPLDVPPDPLSMTDQEIEVLQALAARRRELELHARQLDQREVLLRAAERRIDEKVDGLKALKKSIQELLIRHDEQVDTQFRSLVKIYESMKPKDAARIFNELDMAVLLPVVERMKERKTAPILAKMNPEKAKAITLRLADRRDLPIVKD